jgi:glycosyltransferase involved in cell wall biosynthesis
MIVLITDAAPPQVNGVVVTIMNTAQQLRRLGHEVELITPADFTTVPMPLYRDIPVSILPGYRLRRRLEASAVQAQPLYFHLFTEGPLGLAARNYLVRRKLRFTTSYHTDFPQYLRQYLKIPPTVTWRALRWFHRPAEHVLVSTPAMAELLASKGIPQVALWGRGIDPDIFTKGTATEPPYFLYAGRVAREKGIEEFLRLELPGEKVVVGDGPHLPALQRRFPAARYVGRKSQREMAVLMGGATALVFPSRTDTFGIVMAEANSCGTPVAAFPVRGPLDVVQPGLTGFLSTNLEEAARCCLELDRDKIAAYARERFSWQHCTAQFLGNLREARRLGEQPAIA